MIKLGCCIPGGSFMPQGVGEVADTAYSILADGCKAAVEIGFDYAECGVGMIMKLSDEEFDRAVSENKLKISACNSFMPGDIRICRLDERLEAYVDNVMKRLSALGVKILVFGSGRSRRFIEGENYSQGREAILAFLRLCDGYASRYGLIMALEPLNSAETNVVVTVDEGADVVRTLNSKGCAHIKLLADTYHMSHEPFNGVCTAHAEGDWNERAISAVAENIDIIVHAHAAEPFDRRYPGSHDGKYVAEFIAQLKTSGYSGGISVECGFTNFLAEAKAAYEFLRSCVSDK